MAKSKVKEQLNEYEALLAKALPLGLNVMVVVCGDMAGGFQISKDDDPLTVELTQAEAFWYLEGYEEARRA